MGKKYAIETWGCQMNEEDSEKLSGMLHTLGYERTMFKNKADVILFNTCAVRENAEIRVHGSIGALKPMKQANPDLIIAVCGCMMQQKDVAEEILRKHRHVDIVFGTHNAYKFPEYLERARNEGVQIREVFEKETEIVEGVPITRDSSVTAYVTIMYGCDNFCTYCIVPHVRGRERSRVPEDIVKEVETLVAKGYREVTLLGQNVNSYGRGLEDPISFSSLLRLLNRVEGLVRIRFLTSHPKDMGDDVILAMKECTKVVEQVHLPVQSGSDRILRLMNRGYTRADYADTVRRIRDGIEGVSLSTDIIVGFPGETEEDFQETLSLVEEVGYDVAFTFIYSRRKYTPADAMDDHIPDEVKHERFNRLVEAVNRNCRVNSRKYWDGVHEVLIEGPSKNNGAVLQGKTRTGKTVNVEGGDGLIGTMVNVRIVKATSFCLYGEIIKE